MADLWLNAPIGYPYAEKVNQNDEGGLRRFAIMICSGDKDMEDMVRGFSHTELVQFFLDSNFSFDADWYGPRQPPIRPDGTNISALDDSYYRLKNGVGGPS